MQAITIIVATGIALFYLWDWFFASKPSRRCPLSRSLFLVIKELNDPFSWRVGIRRAYLLIWPIASMLRLTCMAICFITLALVAGLEGYVAVARELWRKS